MYPRRDLAGCLGLRRETGRALGGKALRPALDVLTNEMPDHVEPVRRDNEGIPQQHRQISDEWLEEGERIRVCRPSELVLGFRRQARDEPSTQTILAGYRGRGLLTAAQSLESVPAGPAGVDAGTSLGTTLHAV